MKKLFFAVIFVITTSCVSTKPNIDSFPYLTEIESGFVPNEEVAISLAKIYFLTIYGETVKKIKQYEATLIDEVWYVNGILDEGLAGGCPYIKINKKDGEVLGIIYTK